MQAAEKAIANPLLDEISLNGARGVLINITGGHDLTLFELDDAANRIREKVDPEANIIVGSTLDPVDGGDDPRVGRRHRDRRVEGPTGNAPHAAAVCREQGARRARCAWKTRAPKRRNPPGAAAARTGQPVCIGRAPGTAPAASRASAAARRLPRSSARFGERPSTRRAGRRASAAAGPNGFDLDDVFERRCRRQRPDGLRVHRAAPRGTPARRRPKPWPGCSTRCRRPRCRGGPTRAAAPRPAPRPRHAGPRPAQRPEKGAASGSGRSSAAWPAVAGARSAAIASCRASPPRHDEEADHDHPDERIEIPAFLRRQAN